MFVYCTEKYAYTLTSNTRVNRYNFDTGIVDLFNHKINNIQSSGIYVKHFKNNEVDPLMITIGRLTADSNINQQQ